MKLYRSGPPGAETPIIEIDSVLYDATPVGDFTPEFWAEGGPRRLGEMALRGRLRGIEPAEGERLGSPVASAHAVICIGQNYAAHAAESGAEPPAQPILFLETPNTIAGPDDDVTIPAGSEKTDWEVELGIVIGKRSYALSDTEEAAAAIGGYVLVNDLSERAFQLEVSGGQWSKGKCCPGYLPLGPWVVTADEFDPSNVGLRSFVNGEPRQNSTTADMIFDCPRIVYDLSQYMQLEAGDVICTGTPEGVALSGRFPYLRDGDTVRVEIDGLGAQEQRFRAAEVAR